MICSVGQRLRQARLEQGLDLSTVVAQTKINEKYLKAIEADNRDLLPSAFFYRHFVDQYARALRLDAQEIAAEVDRVLSVEAPLPLPGFRVSPLTYAPRESSGRLYVSLSVLVLALLGCSGFYAWWHKFRTPAAPTAAVLPSKNEPRKVQSAKVVPPPVAPSVSLAAPQPVSPRAPSTPEGNRASLGYKLLLDLVARESTWLSVSSDGHLVFTGILAPHETKTVEGKEFAKLRVGNAAGLDVRLNGRNIGPLGSRGQVLVVVFTPDNFQIVAPAKEGD